MKKSVYERFCPFKVGQRVELTKTLDIEQASDWYHGRHYLVQGSPGVVLSRGFRNNQFDFEVKFDLESWIRTHNPEKKEIITQKEIITHVRSRHVYILGEGCLALTVKEEAVFGRVEEPDWFGAIKELAKHRYGYDWDWKETTDG